MVSKSTSGLAVEVTLDRQSLIFRPNVESNCFFLIRYNCSKDYVSGVAKIKGLKTKLDLSVFMLKAEGEIAIGSS